MPAGSKGSSTAQCTSVKSGRLAAATLGTRSPMWSSASSLSQMRRLFSYRSPPRRNTDAALRMPPRRAMSKSLMLSPRRASRPRSWRPCPPIRSLVGGLTRPVTASCKPTCSARRITRTGAHTTPDSDHRTRRVQQRRTFPYTSESRSAKGHVRSKEALNGRLAGRRGQKLAKDNQAISWSLSCLVNIVTSSMVPVK